MPVADGPQSRHEDEDDRVEHDRVGDREEPVDRTEREHRSRDGNERVRGVEVTSEQEPGDPGPETATAQAPFVQALHAGVTPLRGHEAHDRDEREEGDQHCEGHNVDAHMVVRCCQGKGVHRPAS